ncbi:MAG: NUDIX hydrolase [Anaerolineae bacterium]
MSDDFKMTPAEAASLRQGFAYCPRCRAEMVDRFLYGRTRRLCPDCNFVQFIDPKVSAAVMVVQKGKVLLVRRAMDPGRGSWCFPGGFMEIGETPQATAIRECREESGLEVEITRLLDVYYYEDFRGSGVVIMYQARVTGGRLEANPEEADGIGFFGPDELPQPIEFDSNLKALASWQNSLLAG